MEATKTFPKNKLLEVFDHFIGKWETTGTHGMIPNTILHGTTTFRWHPSGAFIIIESSINEDVGIPDGIALIGSDDTLGTYTMIYYDDRGVSRNYNLTIKDNIIKSWRDAPEFSQRNELQISEDGQTIISKGEISTDKSTWEQDLNLTYKKV